MFRRSARAKSPSIDSQSPASAAIWPMKRLTLPIEAACPVALTAISSA